MENNLGMLLQGLGPGGRCREFSASAAAKGPAAASALARTPGADVLRLRERPEDAVPAKADDEATPTAATAARAAATTAATTK